MKPVDSLEIPRPKFELFETAVYVFRDEDGRYHGGHVQIMGIEWCPVDSTIGGWWYQCQDLMPRSESWLKEPIREPSPEADLFKLTRSNNVCQFTSGTAGTAIPFRDAESG